MRVCVCFCADLFVFVCVCICLFVCICVLASFQTIKFLPKPKKGEPMQLLKSRQEVTR